MSVCVIAQRHLNMYERDMLFIGEKQKNQKESEKKYEMNEKKQQFNNRNPIK